MKNSIVIVCVGILLAAIGSYMLTCKVVHHSTREELKEGNKKTTTAAGAIAGAATGTAAGVAIGGIGVAAMGTGIGIPVGVVCLGLAAILGSAGGGVGYALGKDDSIVLKPYSYVEPAFPEWICICIVVAGVLVCLYGARNLYQIARAKRAEQQV